MSNLEVFVYAILGGLFVVLVSSGIRLYRSETATTKEMSRNFLLGAAVTGILYPNIPETLDGVKDILTAEELPVSTKSVRFDSDVKVGPANF